MKIKILKKNWKNQKLKLKLKNENKNIEQELWH